MPGFDSKQLRKANRIKVVCDGEFKATLIGGFELGFGIKLGSLFGDASSFGETYNNIASVANFLIGSAGGQQLPVGIDIPRKVIYAGSSPLKFTLRTALFIETSYDADIAGPLNTLLKWVLPKSDDSVTLNTAAANISAKADAGSDAWKIAQKFWDKTVQYLGDIKKLTPPEAFNKKANLIIGEPKLYEFKEVFLKDFRVKVPTLFYFDGGKPVPDHVEVDLDFETLRVASAGNFSF